LPPRAVEKGNFGPALSARIITDKFLYHMPLNRQNQKYLQEYGVDFPESTLCDIVKNSCFWFKPIYDC
jgi:transposase